MYGNGFFLVMATDYSVLEIAVRPLARDMQLFSKTDESEYHARLTDNFLSQL
jgi:hypothetical protein